MSEIRVNKVVNEAGSGAPEFPQGSTSAGVVTAVSFSGSGANLTGIASTDNITSDSINVVNLNITGVATAATFAGITTFHDLNVGGNYTEDSQAVSALDVNCADGNYFTKTIAGVSTFTFSNAPTAGKAYAFTLELTHTSGSANWPATVKWPNDTAPSLTAGKTHLFMFVTDDSGSRWRGSSLVNYTN
tara:strand:- start:1403 stop:1966 length:564 start_codon:yes stop_codon:yes gene_type:complete